MLRKAIVLCLALAMLLAPVMTPRVEASNTYGSGLAASAAALVGSPYRLGGTDPAGFDASGLVVYVYGLYGAEMPRTVASQFTVGTQVARRSDLRAGDIMLFESGSVRWTGIYLGSNEVVWASSGAGRVIKANITDSNVSDNLHGARRLPDSAFSPREALAGNVLSLLGATFRLGSAGPSQFDASGLTQYVHSMAGVEIPRTIANQYAGGTNVTRSQLQPGDLIFFGTSSSSPTLVAVFIGSGRFVFASSSAGQVIERSLSDANYNDNAIGARRYIGSSPSTPPPPPPPPKLDTASAVIKTAESFMGTPYVFGASGPDTFVCSGFTRYVFAQHGISLPRTSVSQATAGTRVASRGDMKKGDLLIFVDTYKAGISHVGIYIGNDQFIHTIPNGGVGYASLTTSYWSTRLHSARRLIN